MDEKVESNNQSGGITAFNVNVDDNNRIAGRDANVIKVEGRSKVARIAVWIAIAAGVVTILGYFGLKPKEETVSEDKKNINVTSHNQTGGITAYNVNIGPQDRKLTPQLADQLVEHIKTNKIEKVTVTSVMGDQEAFQFASVIKAFLTDQGVSVDGVNQAVYSKPMRGQIVNPGKEPNTIDIIIGGQ